MGVRLTNKHGIVCTVEEDFADELLATGNFKKESTGRRAKKDDGSTANQGGGDGGQNPQNPPDPNAGK
ncbi:hypothetical protein SEA_CAMBIARE_9 [Mycobacterium phage Cambiare]|uniref:Head-to-tail connector protein n=1 Tax=Mycobacterium phage Cambiare TaxID=1647305 RepID=A0A0F6YRV3_9CAUD|nr:head-tail connector protein [Mycobacterium phage Cambiare]AKF14511.1 hypothetical protein SEA_CAMBIARE_9 [Mycobacterium phage Cambiare]